MNGIIWSGKSKIDNNPITAILTGSDDKSKNRKTGDIQQIWTLRSDISPTAAVKSGEDYSICGDCPNRGEKNGKKRACYVSVFRGPLAIYKKLKRGGHTVGAKINPRKPTRFGAYGEPSLLPITLVSDISLKSSGWVGYTHRWRTISREYSEYFMASVSSIAEAREANKLGYRCFMVLPIGKPEPKGFINCPASEEAGHKTECSKCLLCNGGKGKNIWIRAHGRGKNFIK